MPSATNWCLPNVGKKHGLKHQKITSCNKLHMLKWSSFWAKLGFFFWGVVFFALVFFCGLPLAAPSLSGFAKCLKGGWDVPRAGEATIRRGEDETWGAPDWVDVFPIKDGDVIPAIAMWSWNPEAKPPKIEAIGCQAWCALEKRWIFCIPLLNRGYSMVFTLPETNSSHLKMDVWSWNTNFLLGWPIFRCYVSFRECMWNF